MGIPLHSCFSTNIALGDRLINAADHAKLARDYITPSCVGPEEHIVPRISASNPPESQPGTEE